MVVAETDARLPPLIEVTEARPGSAWAEHFRLLWPGYRRWFLARQRPGSPSLTASRAQLGRYLPELVPTWERLVELARDRGAGDLAARFLTLYRPPPFLSGCSILVTSDPDSGEPVMVRNYDYDPELWDGVLWRSAWSGHDVLAFSDCLWGALDGMNAHGLAVALAFGGRRTIGDGFAIPLVVRLLLETCRDVEDAASALERVPSHMSYSLLLVDARGGVLRAELAPDHPPRFDRRPWVTNHQGSGGAWPAYEKASRTHERGQTLDHLARAATLRDQVEAFRRPPLFTSDFERSFATLYTTAWHPVRQTATVTVRGQEPRTFAVSKGL